MKGKFSSSEFLRLYPLIIPTYYSCTNLTTSEDIKNIFQIAKNKLKNLSINNIKNEDSPISMIFFDGLDLIKQSNLNIINLYLDFDLNIKNTTFIGISNSGLNVSKINRASILSVSCLCENMDDIISTSISIAESINDEFGGSKIFKKILPNVYFYFWKSLKLIKKLIVFKKYELKEYKNLIDKYKKDKDFKNIYAGIGDLEDLKEMNKKIYEFDTFKKVKNKNFCFQNAIKEILFLI